MTSLEDKLKNAQTWCDLRGQLTDSQISFFLRFEEEAVGDPVEVAQHLLEGAREHARQNRVDAERFGHLPAPAGAVKLYHWEDDGRGHWSRQFTGISRGVELPGRPKLHNKADVSIDGLQHEDGTIQIAAYVHADSLEMTSAELRQFAVEMLAVADEIERLSPPAVDTSRNW